MRFEKLPDKCVEGSFAILRWGFFVGPTVKWWSVDHEVAISGRSIEMGRPAGVNIRESVARCRRCESLRELDSVGRRANLNGGLLSDRCRFSCASIVKQHERFRLNERLKSSSIVERSFLMDLPARFFQLRAGGGSCQMIDTGSPQWCIDSTITHAVNLFCGQPTGGVRVE